MNEEIIVDYDPHPTRAGQCMPVLLRLDGVPPRAQAGSWFRRYEDAQPD